jgi:hypothetical protein
MSRYLIFGGQVFYSKGGACDLVGIKNDIDAAISQATNLIGQEVDTFDKTQHFKEDRTGSLTIEWTHILDVVEGKITHEFGESPLGRDSEIVKQT